MRPGRIRIGTSGWRYPPWRGAFYPEGLAQRRELEFASSCFDSVEVNGSFYSLQRPASWTRWLDETPEDFVFAVKGGRYITHMLKMRAADAALANFFGSGVLALGSKLGPVLWQLPARQAFDAEVLDAFLGKLPRDARSASALAERADEKLKHEPVRAPEEGLGGRSPAIRHALEARHESFRSTAAIELLRRHGVALVESDGGDRWPRIRESTADFLYIRLHGAEELYASGYGSDELEDLAEHLAAHARGGVDGVIRDAFVYFDNDAKVRAPFDAMTLGRLVDGRGPADPDQS